VPDSAEDVQGSAAVVAFDGQVVGNCFGGQGLKRVLIDLDQLVEFFEVIIATAPEVL
jgi:hypothetical protein